MNEKGSLEALNLFMGIIAVAGGILVILNRVDYGLVLLIISTLIEAIGRIVK